jgi:hypothetical protein
MATIDLGRIKQVWRGTYAGGTAYVPDDVVSYADGSVTSSYICTANTTGNAPSSGGTLHASWAYMAKGQASSPTTTRGDIIYRGASADARLAKGTQGYVLKQGANDPEWAESAGGGVLQIKRYHYTGEQTVAYPSAWGSTNIAVAITPTKNDSHFWISAYVSAGHANHDSSGTFNIHDSALGSDKTATAQQCFTNPNNSSSPTNEGYMSAAHSFGSQSAADDYYVSQSFVGGMYNPAANSSSARTFTVVMKGHAANNNMYINGTAGAGDNNHAIQASSYIEVWEIANAIYS